MRHSLGTNSLFYTQYGNILALLFQFKLKALGQHRTEIRKGSKGSSGYVTRTFAIFDKQTLSFSHLMLKFYLCKYYFPSCQLFFSFSFFAPIFVSSWGVEKHWKGSRLDFEKHRQSFAFKMVSKTQFEDHQFNFKNYDKISGSASERGIGKSEGPEFFLCPFVLLARDKAKKHPSQNIHSQHLLRGFPAEITVHGKIYLNSSRSISMLQT